MPTFVRNKRPAPIREAVSKAVKHSAAVVILGGDNSITYPAAKSATGLLTFDAHFDLGAMDNGLSNGNPIRALLADGFPGGQIVQVGIQSFANSRAYADVARQSGITFITLEQVRLRGIENVTAEALTQLSNSADFIYVDFDLDVLDRTFAPAASGSRPGGLAPWELRRAARLCGLHPRVRAIDLVEIDPTRDVADATVASRGRLSALVHIRSASAPPGMMSKIRRYLAVTRLFGMVPL